MTQTLTTEQLRAHAESLGLDFFIERRAGIWVKEWLNDGCTSATAEEVLLWSMLANREAQPVDFILGMEVSIDVSTCDADAGHRLFGTVTEVSELDGAKNGCILLVQDAEPNYIAPPAPAVPEEITPAQAQKMLPSKDYVMNEDELNVAADMWNACRAAMLAQPVSQYFKSQASINTNDERAMRLPAAPEGGNGQN